MAHTDDIHNARLPHFTHADTRESDEPSDFWEPVPGTGDDVRPASQEVVRLDRTLTSLVEQIKRLEDRLIPILAPGTADKAQASKAPDLDPGHHSPLSVALSSYVHRLDDIQDAIATLIERVEV